MAANIIITYVMIGDFYGGTHWQFSNNSTTLMPYS